MLIERQDFKPMTDEEQREFFINKLAELKATKDIQRALVERRKKVAYEMHLKQLAPPGFNRRELLTDRGCRPAELINLHGGPMFSKVVDDYDAEMIMCKRPANGVVTSLN